MPLTPPLNADEPHFFSRGTIGTVDAQNPALPDDQKIQDKMHLDNGSRPVSDVSVPFGGKVGTVQLGQLRKKDQGKGTVGSLSDGTKMFPFIPRKCDFSAAFRNSYKTCWHVGYS